MKIQLWHCRDSNFREELYTPLKQNFSQIEWIFPHQENGGFIKSEESLKWVDIFLAEVSYPATWLWIELGFAYLYKKRIICISKRWFKISESLKYVCNEFVEYDEQNDMIEKLRNIL
jgi:hypothetical protein